MKIHFASVFTLFYLFLNRKWYFQSSFGFIRNIILDNSQEKSKFAIEVQTQKLQLLYLQCHIFNEHDFNNLVTEWGGKLNYLEDPDSLTDALCQYYDREDTSKNWSSSHKNCDHTYTSNSQSSFKFNILIVGNTNYYKSKFVSTYTNTKLKQLHERSFCFTENTKEIKTENSTVILNVIEGPKLNEYSSLIADKLESVDAWIFVYDRDMLDSFETVERFVKANRLLLNNIEWVLWENIAKEESSMKEENVTKFCSKFNCAFYEFPFDRKYKIDTVFDAVIKSKSIAIRFFIFELFIICILESTYIW